MEPHNTSKTSCVVHQLLEKQKKSRTLEPSAVASHNKNQKLDKGASSNEKEIHSRLLTKRQLSDMAMGVRELSRQLVGVRLKLNVRTVFLLVKAHDESLLEVSRELVDWLLSTDRDTQYTVFACHALGRTLKH